MIKAVCWWLTSQQHRSFLASNAKQPTVVLAKTPYKRKISFTQCIQPCSGKV